jgi:hypothetical protein
VHLALDVTVDIGHGGGCHCDVIEVEAGDNCLAGWEDCRSGKNKVTMAAGMDWRSGLTSLGVTFASN